MPHIVIATGGTGGHIFPAEALAKELMADGYTITFIGGGLHTNRYFHRADFTYHEITAPPFSLLKLIPFSLRIGRGITQACKLLEQLKPDLVIGFGSFYTVPVLTAARLHRAPILLFEPNAFPGKVTRLFSRWAKLSAVQFDEAGKHLKGPTSRVKMPLANFAIAEKAQALDYFYLHSNLFTFLIFGGSQGARTINDLFFAAARQAPALFQVIHITGDAAAAHDFRRKYAEAGIAACVKAFEERMDLAWSAASAAICRAGAATLAEARSYKVPSLVIPFAKAADDHQTKNALATNGVLICPEKALTEGHFATLLQQLLSDTERAKLQAAMEVDLAPPFSDLVKEIVCSTS